MVPLRVFRGWTHQMIELRGCEPIAQGHKRFVYEHPRDGGLLIKVWKPEIVEARWGRRAPLHQRLRRYGPYVSFRREISEHLALAVRHPRGVPVLQTPAGVVETDMGLGVVVEKLVGHDGGLAPTLSALTLREGLTPHTRAKLRQFLAELLHYGVVIGKLHGFNLVLAVREGQEERFVMIDGYGEKSFIPIHAWWPRINAAHTRRRVAAMVDSLPIAAEDKAGLFSVQGSGASDPGRAPSG